MRLDHPRLSPIAPADLPDEIRERLGPEPLNIFRTLAHHPDLLRRWLVFGGHVLAKSTLPAREREMLILRIGWLCRAGYEWTQHVAIALQSGLSDAEIARIAEGPDAEGWTPDEAALLRAVDELHADAFVSDATWKALATRWSPQQLIDLVFTVGQYQLVSMALNSLGVQLESGRVEWPDAPGGGGR